MASNLRLTDESFRDGPQSLWANRFETDDMLHAARHAGVAGYERCNLLSAVGFEVAINFLREDPLERFRLLRRLIGDTPSTILVRSRNLFGWTTYSDDVITFFFEFLASLGLDGFQVFDALNDTRNIRLHIQEGARLGLYASACIAFSESPVHTDEYFAGKAKELASFGASALLLYDATGVLRPERVVPLVAAVRAAAPGLPVELNVHDQTGLALGCYREALKAGVTRLSTAARPVAGANSVPATADVIDLADSLGIAAELDRVEIQWLDSYFRYVAYKYGKPQRNVVTFDEANYRGYVSHQIPGGMMSHYVGQLQALGLLDRLPEVLQEAGRVRVELGCPVMVTPFSQIVGVQAILNVLDGKRYHTVPMELRAYAAGHYGEPPGAIDPLVLDRIGGEEIVVDSAPNFSEETLPRVRATLPPDARDEDLFFALFSNPDHVRRMQQQRAITTPAKELSPLAALVGLLAARQDITSLSIRIDAR